MDDQADQCYVDRCSRLPEGRRARKAGMIAVGVLHASADGVPGLPPELKAIRTACSELIERNKGMEFSRDDRRLFRRYCAFKIEEDRFYVGEAVKRGLFGPRMTALAKSLGLTGDDTPQTNKEDP